MADPVIVTPDHSQLAVVALPAEIDVANYRQVRRELYSALATGVAVVVADMTATTCCDSMGFRTLVLAHERATAISTELRLVVTSAHVLQVMAILGLDTMLRIYPSPYAALTARPRGNDPGKPRSSREPAGGQAGDCPAA
jgi:anti-sigma B factor antagonist